MLDIKFVREHSDEVQLKSNQKGYKVDVGHIIGLDDQRRELLSKTEEIRRQRNELSNKFKTSRPSESQIAAGRDLKTNLAESEDRLRIVDEEFTSAFKKIPNMPDANVPVGLSEDDNVVTKEFGKTPNFDFAAKTHWELGEQRGWLDKKRAAKVAGSRFVYVMGDLVKLQWAMFQFAMDVLTSEEILQKIAKNNNLQVSTKPFKPVLPPLLLKTEIYDAMDRLEPRDDRYKIEGDELWLQGSAEHVLGSIHADEIIEEADLPIRYLGYATSFRREAGTYGKDMEGIIRMHQFDKMEMVSLDAPENAYAEHQFMVAIQEYLMQQLGLPYRVLDKCTADIGKPNAHGVDIDIWFPGQNKYRESHTADYMTDYQSRRLNTRLRRKNGDLELVHNNDATVLSQRPLISILENNQQKDGTIVVPEVLVNYLGGRRTI